MLWDLSTAAVICQLIVNTSNDKVALLTNITDIPCKSCRTVTSIGRRTIYAYSTILARIWITIVDIYMTGITKVTQIKYTMASKTIAGITLKINSALEIIIRNPHSAIHDKLFSKQLL